MVPEWLRLQAPRFTLPAQPLFNFAEFPSAYLKSETDDWLMLTSLTRPTHWALQEDKWQAGFRIVFGGVKKSK
jgi:hypothetical protein